MFPPHAATASTANPLDQAPPSPQSLGAGPTGQATPFSLSAIAPGVPSAQLPPEMQAAIIQASQTIFTMLDSFAQATPDLAAQWAQIKDQVAAVLAQLVQGGAPPMSPTATGQQFPAAFDRGVSGAGMI